MYRCTSNSHEMSRILIIIVILLYYFAAFRSENAIDSRMVYSKDEN